MRVRITDTPDRQYLGHEFDSSENPIILAEDVQVYIDRILPLPDGVRFISSSYIIDTMEV